MVEAAKGRALRKDLYSTGDDTTNRALQDVQQQVDAKFRSQQASPFATGRIITKVSMKLFPHKSIVGAGQFVVEDEDLIPEIIHKITHTEMVHDLVAYSQAIPPFSSGLHHLTINLSADSEKELAFKMELVFDDTLGPYIRSGDGGYLGFNRGSQRPQVSKTSDWRKGGGFEYVGSIMPVET